MNRLTRRAVLAAVVVVSLGVVLPTHAAQQSGRFLHWDELPSIPDELGLAGPFAGVSQGVLIVAGGANFPQPVWESEKTWRDDIFVLVKEERRQSIDSPGSGGGFGATGYHWIRAGRLQRPLAYGAAVSYGGSLVCMGGADSRKVYREVFALTWNPETGSLTRDELPPLPKTCAYGAAAVIGDQIYLAGGQSGTELETAMSNFWMLDMSKQGREFRWRELPSWPGPLRAFNLAVAQHNGFNTCLYVLSGRRVVDGEVDFLTDLYEFDPSRGEDSRDEKWKRKADSPFCVMAGTTAPVGQSHFFVFGGADGSLFHRVDELRDRHPGFPRRALAFHTITGTWTAAGETPINQVTTLAVPWEGMIVIPTGEIRPRVRSPQVWAVRPVVRTDRFGTVNYLVLFVYLAIIVSVGVYFTKKNRDSDDFFRGGKRMVWWAAGCSIFATMLSSLTFTGIPSKAYAQDMVYLVGNFMIPAVAFLAVYVALPFYRRIDATSAYEYLEKRFTRPVRLFASASFTLFHVFRMAVVMSLTGLALSAATPLTPGESVLLMGVLSIIYCTLGGVEAVIWTDTVQTFVLLGGAVLAFLLLLNGIEGGVAGFVATAAESGKFRIANLTWDFTSSQIALWVIILGGIGQNISSYTADQAVVQRYMTTPSRRLAARSIWTNAILSIPASLLFFGIGAALFAFYSSHPDRLDPTITTDQIFPLFISSEMPMGVAGLIVAGVFAAAQSTVSTSMNSTAATIVTDFIRPLGKLRTEKAYLNAARLCTFLMGVAGTLLALFFVDPGIKSLFDAFIQVIGLFMGVLGGLFLLGVATRRAHGRGALVGALLGAGVMFYLWQYSRVNGYIYSSVGIVTCYLVGYTTSLILPRGEVRDLSGLTLFTLSDSRQGDED